MLYRNKDANIIPPKRIVSLQLNIFGLFFVLLNLPCFYQIILTEEKGNLRNAFRRKTQRNSQQALSVHV